MVDMAGVKKTPMGVNIDRPIVLVGMMGVGKTTIGKRLAPKLGLNFVDADEEIVAAAGMSISDLFQRHGEESFRRGEAQVIERLLQGPPLVLATGGGALVTKTTRVLVKEKAVSIWLRADIDTILARATRRPTRPLLQNGDPRATLTRLLDERRPFYEQADIHVDSPPGPHNKTVSAVEDAIVAYLKLETAN